MHAEWQLREAQLICAIDIDDTLCFGTEWWIKFVNDTLNGKYKGLHIKSFTDLNDVKNVLSYNDYRKLKMEYRECGIKSEIPIMPGAKELLDGLKSRGYTIVLLTARPFDTHKKLFKTTIDWLTKNKLQYDDIVFGDDKNFKVIVEMPSMRFMLEDHCSLANQVANWGYTVFLLDNKYNYDKTIHSNVIRIKKLTDVLEYIDKMEGMHNDKKNSS